MWEFLYAKAAARKAEHKKLRARRTAAQIEELSSGIVDVQVIEKEADPEAPSGKGNSRMSWFQFRLDRKAVKPTIPSLDGQSTEPMGGYVFALPQVGEFNIEFGEILEGKSIPLHRDDFCMK